ncbi:MAG: ArsR/SmtB family transcription factor [Pirellulaceae bacterium]
MDAKTQARFDARAKVVKALAHPTRLFIVDELSRRGERCVCELTEMVGADISTVSKHLSLLKAAGIVADEKRGNMVYYRLGIPCVSQFFDCIEAVLQGNVGQCRRALV